MKKHVTLRGIVTAETKVKGRSENALKLTLTGPKYVVYLEIGGIPQEEKEFFRKLSELCVLDRSLKITVKW